MHEKCEQATSEFLESLYKNVSMGKQSLLDTMSKVRNAKLKDELTEQLCEYEKYCNEINELIEKYGGKQKSESLMTKMSAKIGIEMNTLADSTEEHIAQMIVEGTTMGITDTIRLVRDYENTSCAEDALALGRKIVGYWEKAVERTKKYL